ncbi:MAG: hypothetical protein V1934_00375 [Methanobacteriota archaeon]
MCRYDRGFNKGFMWAMRHSAEEVGRYLASRRARPKRSYWKGYMDGVRATEREG